MRIPSEQTFSVAVRSVAVGSWGLEISTGTVSRVRFSSRPDRVGISEMAFQVGFSLDSTGLDGAERLQKPLRTSAAIIP